MLRPPDASSVKLAERLSTSVGVGVVHATRAISPSLHEIVLHGVSALAGVPGNDVMLEVTHEGRPVRRRYSVRSVDRELDTLTLWIATHHDGAGATLARTVTEGTALDVVGPRGKIGLDELADWHLCIGDVSSLAAFYRLAESIEPPGRVVFIIEVDDPADALTPSLPEGLGVTGIFVDRDGRPRGTADGLLSGLAAFAFPPDDGHAYLFGEFGAMNVLRTALLDRGLSPEAISLKAFWRVGSANADHGEPDKTV
ncbi:MAG: siderophore-interacting protein [Acidobacteria bacterium]|nr:siderophore-interacting protein [Acidobacteriota bacterium]